jgi:hypothetical protein
MTQEEEKIKVLTLLMWLQTAVYAADECQEIAWFNTRRSKQLLKSTVDIILKEHGEIIKTLWDVDGVQMPEVTKALEEFTGLLSTTDYYKLPEISALIRAYQAGEFEDTFNPIRDEQQLTSRGRE